MRVAVYYNNRDLRIEERPLPKIGRGELLIRVEACGVCGSDCLEWYRLNRVPLVLGHEISGTIEEIGSGVKNFKKGDRVACAHHVPCEKCRYCLSGHETVCETLRKTNFDPGGFSEFVRLPAINVEKGTFLLPENVSFPEATFVEPLACVLRGQRLAGGVKEKRALVIGCGIAGILHLHLAKFFGAGYVTATDITEYRLNLAKKFGADCVINAKEYRPGELFDLVIVTTGAPSALQQAFASVGRGGTVLFFAPTENDREIPVPFNKLFWRQEITLTSSYAASPLEYKAALDLIAKRKLNLEAMITHRLALDKIGLGFQLVAEAKESLKVIMEPQKK